MKPSRAIAPGEAFLCLPRANDPAHFLRRAAERGAAAAIVVGNRAADTALPLVQLHTMDEAGRLLRRWFGTEHGSVRCIGITGTDGKTSVTWMLRQALARAGHFLGRLLEELAGPEMEIRIVELVARELGALPADRRRALAEAWAANREPVVVRSAHAIAAKQRQALAEAFRQALGPSEVGWTFTVDPGLVAGLHISIGAWTLAANLRDEMRFFTDGGHG